MLRLTRRRAPALLSLAAGCCSCWLSVTAAAAAPADAPAAATLADALTARAYGLRAFHRGDDEEAVRRLREAVAQNPDDGLSAYWLGLAYLRRGDGAGAVAAFEAARAADVAPPVAPQRLADDLASARRLAAGGAPEERSVPELRGGFIGLLAEPRWEWRGGVTASNDSNPLRLADGDVAFPPGADPVIGPTGDVVTNLDLRGEFHPFYDRGGWSLGVAATADQALYRDFDFLDLTTGGGLVQLAWGKDPLGYLAGPLGYTRVPFGDGTVALLVQGRVGYSWLDGDSFERLAELGLAGVVRETSRTATQLDLRWGERTRFADGTGVDEQSGEESSAELSQFLYLGRRDRYLRLAAQAGTRDAGARFAADHVEARAELALPLGRRWAFHLATAWREVAFDELESNPVFPFFLADAPREDTLRELTGELIWAATDHLRLVARGSRVERETDLGSASAVLDLDYDRTVGSLGVSWLF